MAAVVMLGRALGRLLAIGLVAITVDKAQQPEPRQPSLASMRLP
ncbi:hypothetical protein [Streptomyces sp. NPDC000405]